MNPYLSFVITFLILFGRVCADHLSLDYKNVISDCNASGNNFWVTTAPSLSSCCSHCSRDRRCMSVSYRRLNGTCITHDICPSSCNGFGFHEPGWSLICLVIPSGINRYASCSAIQQGFPGSPDGVYTIYTPSTGQRGTKVYCDMTTEGGGWTVFQHRFDGSVDFYRNWEDYKNGFGHRDGENWLGHDILHDLTKPGWCTLRIDMISIYDEAGYAKYSDFSIGSEQDQYALKFNQYLGAVGDALSIHKGQGFSTKDRDNDADPSGGCAEWHHGAWWYEMCYSSNLNGRYRGPSTVKWYNWKVDERISEKNEDDGQMLVITLTKVIYKYWYMHMCNCQQRLFLQLFAIYLLIELDCETLQSLCFLSGNFT